MLRLKELREKREMNMRQAAKALEIPYTTYISYEKGEREPNSEMLIKLAEFFLCSVDYLVGRSDQFVDDDTWDGYVKKIGQKMQERRDSNRNLLKQLLPDIPEDDLYVVASQIIPAIRTMNHAGIGKLAERADELCRLYEYMNTELREIEESIQHSGDIQ